MTDTMLSFFVPGRPVSQGSKRHVGNGKMVEQSKGLEPWRESIRWAAIQAGRSGPVGLLRDPKTAVVVRLWFVMPRPVSTPKRSTPPAVKKPDLDKLVRAVCDALTSAGTWKDDSQVVELFATKRLAEIGEAPGVLIQVGLRLPEEEAA